MVNSTGVGGGRGGGNTRGVWGGKGLYDDAVFGASQPAEAGGFATAA